MQKVALITVCSSERKEKVLSGCLLWGGWRRLRPFCAEGGNSRREEGRVLWWVFGEGLDDAPLQRGGRAKGSDLHAGPSEDGASAACETYTDSERISGDKEGWGPICGWWHSEETGQAWRVGYLTVVARLNLPPGQRRRSSERVSPRSSITRSLWSSK